MQEGNVPLCVLAEGKILAADKRAHAEAGTERLQKLLRGRAFKFLVKLRRKHEIDAESGKNVEPLLKQIDLPALFGLGERHDAHGAPELLRNLLCLGDEGAMPDVHPVKVPQKQDAGNRIFFSVLYDLHCPTSDKFDFCAQDPALRAGDPVKFVVQIQLVFPVAGVFHTQAVAQFARLLIVKIEGGEIEHPIGRNEKFLPVFGCELFRRAGRFQREDPALFADERGHCGNRPARLGNVPAQGTDVRSSAAGDEKFVAVLRDLARERDGLHKNFFCLQDDGFALPCQLIGAHAVDVLCTVCRGELLYFSDK